LLADAYINIESLKGFIGDLLTLELMLLMLTSLCGEIPLPILAIDFLGDVRSGETFSFIGERSKSKSIIA
jgi:hypothetical protein